MGGNEHVSERFRKLLAHYRKSDGSEWGGQDLENATGGSVTRSYVANLKNGRIENPGLAKLGAISGAMGFPPTLWFGDTEGEGFLEVLPDGVPLVYKYEAYGSGPTGKRFRITKVAKGAEPHVEVEEVEG